MHTYDSSNKQEKLNSQPILNGNSTRNEDELKKLLSSHRSDDPYLDLANRSLFSIPNQLFILPHIQHLYLEGNNLKELPENFFDRLPALVWLDLRNNKLKSLPPSIGKHQSIKNLLLEGNCLTRLPLQLGLTKSLNGLNLRGNPLQIPPQHIIDQGVYVILSYLYQELQNRTRAPVEKQVEKLNIEEESATSSDEEILTEAINFTGRNIPSPMSDDFELVRHGPTPMSASLHKPVTYQEYKGRFHTSSLVEGLRSKISRGGKKELTLVELKEQEESRQEQLRAMKERQNSMADQRRKSSTALNEWRKETGRRQRLFPRSKTDVDLKPPPYGIDPGPLEVHEDVREEKVEKVLPEESFRRKNEVVQQKKKLHSSQIQNRLKEMRKEKPQADQPIKELQRQLLERKMSKDPELEYRFRAFTGDSRSSSNKTSSM